MVKERTLAEIEVEAAPIEEEILRLSGVRAAARDKQLALRKKTNLLYAERDAYQHAHPSPVDPQTIG